MEKTTKNSLLFSILSMLCIIIAAAIFLPSLMALAGLFWIITLVLGGIAVYKESKSGGKIVVPILAILLPVVVYWFGTTFIF